MICSIPMKVTKPNKVVQLITVLVGLEIAVNTFLNIGELKPIRLSA